MLLYYFISIIIMPLGGREGGRERGEGRGERNPSFNCRVGEKGWPLVLRDCLLFVCYCGVPEPIMRWAGQRLGGHQGLWVFTRQTVDSAMACLTCPKWHVKLIYIWSGSPFASMGQQFGLNSHRAVRFCLKIKSRFILPENSISDFYFD